VKAINVGAAHFAQALAAQGASVEAVDWRPPAGGDPALAARLARLWGAEAVEAANAEAWRRLTGAHPVLVDLQPAGDVIQGLTRDTLLHAGPPIAWERMCGPMRGAILGALLYEGLARDEREAAHLAASGAIRFDPCHHHEAVGPMAGVISASMPVFVVEERTRGGRAYCNLNEGLGKVLRMGAYSSDVLDRLHWLERTLAPLLGRAIRATGGVELRALIAEALQMGDECHNRNRAAGGQFLKLLAPPLAALDAPAGELAALLRFMADNPHFTLQLAMAACKAATDAAAGVPGATLVTAMARNGVEFGLRVSGAPGEWFTAPAAVPDGLLFPGYTAADANPDIGDSAITETGGLGGFAMANAPAIVQFVGGTVEDALRYTREMYEITLGESPYYQVPTLGFRGTPTGIDVRLVLQTGIRPLINTGIAHQEPGIGQIGAGLVRAPWACFVQALEALAPDDGAAASSA
jgi:hypothetical protein